MQTPPPLPRARPRPRPRPWSVWSARWWAAADRRARGGRRPLRLRGEGGALPYPVFYSPNEIRHIVRWHATVRRLPTATERPDWPPAGDWLLAEAAHLHVASDGLSVAGGVSPAREDAGGGAGEGSGWRGAGASLPLAAAVLACLLLLLRAADSCLNTRLLKFSGRRRRTVEWTTSELPAGACSESVPAPAPAGPPSTDDLPAGVPADLPPAYDTCGALGPGRGRKPAQDEPPPPYSACYVTCSAPPDGLPRAPLITPRSSVDGQTHRDDIDTHTRQGTRHPLEDARGGHTECLVAPASSRGVTTRTDRDKDVSVDVETECGADAGPTNMLLVV